MANEREVFQVLTVMAAAYPGFQLQDKTVEVYAEMLADLPGDLLKIAAQQALAESRFFPTIAELRAVATRLTATADGRPTAHEAWGEVKRAISRHGAWGRPEWSHPLVGRAVECLDWQSLCYSQTDDEPSWRAQFIQAYNVLEGREQESARLLPAVREAVAQLTADTHAHALPAPAPDGRGAVNGTGKPLSLAQLVAKGEAVMRERMRRAGGGDAG